MTPEQRQELLRLLERGEELSPEWARILFPPEKREYELIYHGKDREEDIIADTLAVPLQAVRTFGRNGVDWHNILICGDNLQGMKTLVEMKRMGNLRNSDGTDGVRFIYIDPPFATKREFKGTQDQKAYQDKIAGAQFVEFLRKRIVMMKELLAVNGNIVVHLDNRKLHYIKVIMDEIFGEQNFVNEVIWHKGREGGSSRSHSGGSAMPTEYQNLLLYSLDRRERFWRLVLGPYKASTVSRIEKDEKGWFYTRGRMGRQPAEWEIEASVSLKTYVSRDPTKTKEQVIEEITGPKAEFVALGDVWNTDIVPLRTCTDYPTEKPEKLLSLLIASSTLEGDIVLMPLLGQALPGRRRLPLMWTDDTRSLRRCAPLCLSAFVSAFRAAKAVGGYPQERAASAPVAQSAFPALHVSRRSPRRRRMRRALRQFWGATGSFLPTWFSSVLPSPFRFALVWLDTPC